MTLEIEKSYRIKPNANKISFMWNSPDMDYLLGTTEEILSNPQKQRYTIRNKSDAKYTSSWLLEENCFESIEIEEDPIDPTYEDKKAAFIKLMKEKTQ